MNEDTLNLLRGQAAKLEQGCKAKMDEALGLERMARELREDVKRAETIAAELRALAKEAS